MTSNTWESELVSGFMTEHSAVIFVFFFLAEYASIVLICIFISILFLAGYYLDLAIVSYCFEFSYSIFYNSLILIQEIISLVVNDILYIPLTIEAEFDIELGNMFSNIQIENLTFTLILALKSFILIFIFIWVRASFPRTRFDQLMSYCWTVLLPLIFSFIVAALCVVCTTKTFPFPVLYVLYVNSEKNKIYKMGKKYVMMSYQFSTSCIRYASIAKGNVNFYNYLQRLDVENRTKILDFIGLPKHGTLDQYRIDPDSFLGDWLADRGYDTNTLESNQPLLGFLAIFLIVKSRNTDLYLCESDISEKQKIFLSNHFDHIGVNYEGAKDSKGLVSILHLDNIGWSNIRNLIF